METIKLNVTQLNTLIKRIIDAEEFLQTISVYGEVSNFKVSAGNAYFDIKEQGAQISCIKFGAYNLEIKNGDMVLLTGKLNYYVKSGKLSYIANTIEPYGLGELYKKYIELKARLEDEGLFDQRFKKQLPKYANKVGVITSETGAVIRDIVHVAKKKNRFTDILVYPSKVQGLGAEQDIISGINYFENTDVDVVIIARGGGSFEDLAPFNTETLARAIFASSKPIISAVGHETDFSISDFVSDMRAPTPSVAAEIAFYDYKNTKTELSSTINCIIDQAQNFVKTKSQNILDIYKNNACTLKNLCDNSALKLKATSQNVLTTIYSLVEVKKQQLAKTTSIIEKSNPLTILKSGYALISKDSKKITSTEQLEIGDNINLMLSDGKITAIVKNKE